MVLEFEKESKPIRKIGWVRNRWFRFHNQQSMQSEVSFLMSFREYPIVHLALTVTGSLGGRESATFV
jgi:hypothetical protein